MNHFSQKFLQLSFGVCAFLFFGCQGAKTSETVFPDQSSYNTACTSSAIENRYVVKWEDGHYSVEEMPEGSTVDDFRREFVDKNLDQIKFVDRDHRIQLKVQATVLQESVATQDDNWGPYQVSADELWSQNIKGDNVLVGVVDGMIDVNHVQLNSNISSFQQYNNETNISNLNIHGTHVAGIIAADPDKGPIQGIAPHAKIVGGQFIDNSGGGSLGDAIVALNGVAQKGVKVINMSWGGAPCVANLKSALTDLSNNGILLVTASGNEGVNLDSYPSYPAAFGLASQINVAATTAADNLAYFSNRGIYTVQVGAPGVSIYSTIPNNNYELMDGTSMAAPLVTGAAALLFGAFPQATAQDVKSALISGVDTSSALSAISSRGRINVKKAYDTLKTMLSSH